MGRYLLPAVAFLVLVSFLAFGLTRDPAYIPSPLIGKPAPVFDLPNLQDPNTRVSTRDMTGQVALLNVWATWCSGCRLEHGLLMDIARSGEVPIYSLNWKDRRDGALQWLVQYGDPYVATAFDADGRVAIDWGVYGAPETFLVAADGTVLYKHLSPLTPQVWREELLPRIRAARGQTQ